jgi:glycosyltransferase involved in cell wall biosynthesis
MRLAFRLFTDKPWAGDDAVVESALVALRRLDRECPELLLVVDEAAPASDYPGLTACADEVLRVPADTSKPARGLDESLPLHAAWWVRHRLLRRPVRPLPSPLSALLIRHQVDAYFTLVDNSPPVSSVATVAWIPDLQHVRLPENFAPGERAARDRYYKVHLRAAARALATSSAVLHDLRAFAPEHAGKARWVASVSNLDAAVYAADPRAGLAAYHLPEKFVYLPNQFWQHKNHGLVLQALALLRARGVRPVIVCTGRTLDYRRPDYFGEFLRAVTLADLRDQVILLGQVPRADVFRLMRQAVCVLNPSLFEGLGLSVAECHSLGKRVLVSDLPALREQAAPGAVYFDPRDAGDLADKLQTVWAEVPPGPDREMETAARAALPGRQAAFGRALLALFSEAVAAFPPAAPGDDGAA